MALPVARGRVRSPLLRAELRIVGMYLRVVDPRTGEPMLMSAEERRAAAILSESLRRAKALVLAGERDANRVRQLLRETIGLEPLVILEYAEVADAHSLERLDGLTPGRTAVGLLAARVGSTRLIDNETLTE